MNPLISEVNSYPFDRLRNLLGKSSQKKNKNDFINLSIGEPKQNSNKEILKILRKNENLFSQYPPIESIRELTDGYKTYLNKRFGVSNIENENILNLGGTREGTFSVIQSLFNRSLKSKKPFIFMPNPFYQIYGGASLFAGAISKHINLNEEKDFILDIDSVSESQWRRCQLLIMCSPSNPTGSVMEKEEILKVIKLSRKYNFYIVSDECYIDIYRKKPPESFIQVSIENYGNMKNIVSLHSLSKRSNLPGFRSGMICGDKKLINNFKKYRAFHGVSIPLPVQMASSAAWKDEKTVLKNRDFYKKNFELAKKILNYDAPEGAFYMWLKTEDGEKFSKTLFIEKNIVTLPGKYLAVSKNGKNPAENYVRIALVHNKKIVKEALEKISEIL